MNKNEILIHNRNVYKEIYNKIIDKARNTVYDTKITITEVHHILPRCMGGDDSSNNLVRVSIREHIMLHLLLARIYPNNSKIIFACHAMMIGPTRTEVIKKFSSRTISEIKEAFRATIRETGISYDGKLGFIPKSVICYDDNINVVREYYPAYMCEDDGFYKTSVCRACRGQESFGHKYANYNWMYAEEFARLYPNALNKFRTLLENSGTLPELDTSYNKLSYSERLSARKRREMDEEWKMKISKSTTGVKKNIDKEKFHEARIKAYNTMKLTGNFAGRKRQKVKTPNGNYDSLTAAGKAYNVDRHTIQNWINKGKPGFEYL